MVEPATRHTLEMQQAIANSGLFTELQVGEFASSGRGYISRGSFQQTRNRV